ncbi:MAG: nucleoside diphosphate kinase regulator [Acidobacteria bacterium]|nr:nucleoside diphosphate kinase regulator [Acidobacteriota bacterium]
MTKKPVYITEYDIQRLMKLLGGIQHCSQKRADLELLIEEMERAVVVPSEKMSEDVVTLNTRMRVKDLESSEETTIQLVFPNDEDFEHGKISILSPIGAALIGYSKGDTAEWKVPSGFRHLRIEEITYQPEADGLY